MVDVALKCSCGNVEGIAKDIFPGSGNHIVCYCHDCQDFARYLGREDEILDEYGGTDIYQMTPAQLEIHQGKDQIRCMRLKSKGLYRWYTNCCNTPIGNMISGGMPFIGVIHNFMDVEGLRDENLGPVIYYSFGKSATKTPPDDKNDTGFPFFMMLRWACKLLVSRICGQHKPNAFFDDSGRPVSEPSILSVNN